MTKRMFCLTSLMLCGLLTTASAAIAAEEETVAAPKKKPQIPATQNAKSATASDPAKKAAPQPEQPKVCNPEGDVNTLEDIFRETAVAAILVKPEDPTSSTPVVWRRAD